MNRKTQTSNKPAKRGAAAAAARRNSAKSQQQREIYERLASIKAAGFGPISIEDMPKLNLRRG